MPNIVNRMLIQDMTRSFAQAEGMVVCSFGGLDIPETESLRTKLAEQGVEMRMVRNRLARRVLADQGLDFPEDAFAGMTAIAFGSTEATIGAAKVLTEKDVKKAGKVKVRAGLLEGAVLDAQEALALADVPDRDTLNAQILGCISGPARALATVINAVPSGVARVIQAHADDGQGDGGE